MVFLDQYQLGKFTYQTFLMETSIPWTLLRTKSKFDIKFGFLPKYLTHLIISALYLRFLLWIVEFPTITYVHFQFLNFLQGLAMLCVEFVQFLESVVRQFSHLFDLLLKFFHLNHKCKHSTVFTFFQLFVLLEQQEKQLLLRKLWKWHKYFKSTEDKNLMISLTSWHLKLWISFIYPLTIYSLDDPGKIENFK